VPLRDVQEAASHADPRTTMRYDRARTSLDWYATYIVAAFIAERPGKPGLAPLAQPGRTDGQAAWGSTNAITARHQQREREPPMRGITGRLGLSRGRAGLAILSRVLGVMHETAAGDLRGIDHAPALSARC
jgi:hypothetical protein